MKLSWRSALTRWSGRSGAQRWGWTESLRREVVIVYRRWATPDATPDADGSPGVPQWPWRATGRDFQTELIVLD